MVVYSLRALLCVSVALLCVSRHASAEEEAAERGALAAYRPGRFQDFAVASDGRAWAFPELKHEPVVSWRDGRWHEPPGLRPPGRLRHVLEVGPRRWIFLSLTSRGKAGLYDFDGDRFKLHAEVEGRLLGPMLQVASDGTVWVISQNGTAVGVRRTERFVHEFGPLPRGRSYPATLALHVPGRGTWFWSHVAHEMLDHAYKSTPVIEGFHVWRDGLWRTVPFPEGRLGGAVLDADGKIICGSRYKGVSALDPRDGSAVPLGWELPAGEHVVFLHATRSGTILAVTARPSMFRRLPPVKGGWRGTLVAVEGGRTRVLLDGVDLGKARHDNGRPVVETEEGTYIAAAGAGLIFVPSGAREARRLDWRHGLPFADVTRMRAAGDMLYVLSEFRGLAVLDRRKLQEGVEVPNVGRWDVHVTSTEARLGNDDLARCLSATEPSDLLRFAWKSGERIPLTGTGLTATNVTHMSVDTKGRPWLFGNLKARHVAFLDGGRWRVFNRRNAAYAAVAHQERGNEDFRIGWPSDDKFPAFSGDGRVAYMDEHESVHEYDGVAWRRRGDTGFSVFALETPPFYENGVLTVKLTDGIRQWRDGSWVKGPEGVASPYGDEPVFHWKRRPPAGYPGDPERCTIKLRDNTGTFWMGTLDELYRGLGDTWVRFETRGTPLGMAQRRGTWTLQPIGYVLVDARGSIWFGLESREYHRVARYYPSGREPTIEWSREPPRKVWRGVLKLQVKCAAGEGVALVTYELDGTGPKKAREKGGQCAIALAGLRNGTHTCVIRAYDQLLRSSPPLTHTFTVERNYAREIPAELSRLIGTADNRERGEAARALAGIGEPALPYLKQALKAADEDDRWWLRAVIGEIEREIERGTGE